MPSEKILNQKKAKVEELSEKFKKAKMIVLTEYRGISVEDDTKLRAQVRADGNEYVVVKNSTIVYALKAAGIEGIDSLEGPTAVVIGYEDYVAPAKVVNDFAKDHDFYTIKNGRYLIPLWKVLHIKMTTYCCFLPDLTRFIGLYWILSIQRLNIIPFVLYNDFDI